MTTFCIFAALAGLACYGIYRFGVALGIDENEWRR